MENGNGNGNNTKKDFPWMWVAIGFIVVMLIVVGSLWYANKDFLGKTPPEKDPLNPGVVPPKQPSADTVS